jgi:replication-associated recombination protein RarA
MTMAREQPEFFTGNGLNTFEAMSALQKCIRRGLEREAMEFALSMASCGPFGVNLLLKRLRVISHEDIGLADIEAVMFTDLCCRQVSEWHKDKKPGAWRMALGNCIRCLCRAAKSREGDHFQAAVALHMELEGHVPEVPDWAHDMHTQKGKMKGRDLDHFRKESTKLHPTPAEKDPYEDEAYRLWAKKRGPSSEEK